IWGFILEDLKNPAEHRKRRLEAELGFDPEGCPDDLITQAISLEEELGESSFSELAGAYAEIDGSRLQAMQTLIQADGLEGKPEDILHLPIQDTGLEPWEIAVSAARELRRRLGATHGALDNATLH